MKVSISENKQEVGKKSAAAGAAIIRQAIADKGFANVIVATGASQFEMLGELVKEPNIAWNKVNCFHLDEYIGLPITHGASFRKYMWERFVSKLPLPLAVFNYVNGEGDAQAECDRLGAIIARHPIDIAFVGIGENGHIAFNDPPADFDTERAYLVVNLDGACRKQQMGEGWFPTISDVPKQAISMSCKQVMKSKAIICVVPDQRKAQAVKGSLEGPVTNAVPASIMQKHGNTMIFLDKASASLLKAQ